MHELLRKHGHAAFRFFSSHGDIVPVFSRQLAWGRFAFISFLTIPLVRFFFAGRGGNTTKALAMELRSKACRVSRHHCTSHAALESPSYGDASSPWALASLDAASFSRISHVMCWLSVTAFPRAGASHRPSGSTRPPRRRAILGARCAKV